MSVILNNTVVQKYNFSPNIKTKQDLPQNQSAVSANSMQFSSAVSFAQKSSAMPAISFGSLQGIILAKKIDKIIEKYSQGEKPLILSTKSGFSKKIANKIIEKPNKPLIVGLTGQSASGKTTLLEQAEKALGGGVSGEKNFTVIKGDDYYNDISEQMKKEGLESMFKSGFSFDVPDAVELPLLRNDIEKLSKGETIKIPSYDFCSCARTPNAKTVSPSKLIVVDSIFALNKKVSGALDVGIFVQSSPKAIEERFFKRAISERGKTPEAAALQFNDVTQKAQEHIVPTAKSADIILSGEAELEKVSEFYKDLAEIFQSDKTKALS